MKNVSALVKYIITAVVLALLMFVLLNTVGLNFMQNRLVKNKEDELYAEANKIVNDYLMNYYDKSMNAVELIDRLEIAGSITGTRIWMIGSSGLISVDSAVSAFGVNVNDVYDGFLDRTVIKNLVINGIIRDPMLCVTVPVAHNYTLRGYLSIMVPMADIYSEGVYYTDFVNVCYLIFVPMLVLAMMVLYFLTIRPISRLSKKTRAYIADNFKGDFDLSYPKELSELGGTVRYMGERLKGNDETQRKFLSNVSHDFRSPLTSIRGYLEAMKDGTIAKEEQDKYFDILLYETERLTKLTSNLLQLNNIDFNGLMLNLTLFDINKMIRQIALSFEGTFKKKNLVLNLVFSQKETFVEADSDRIQQVIYNLLDNAIKFSNSDSEITITTKLKGSKVSVSVKDNGAGIPKDSINKIWERFYKSDSSRGRDKKGSGLGLSIVKEIIKAHGQDISVVSTVGVGTEFVFTLKSAE